MNGSLSRRRLLTLGAQGVAASFVLAACSSTPPQSSDDPAAWRPRDLVRRIGSVFQNPGPRSLLRGALPPLATSTVYRVPATCGPVVSVTTRPSVESTVAVATARPAPPVNRR